MVTCTSCSANNSDTSNFCSECGAALSPEIAATLPPQDRAVAAESSVDSSLTDSSHHGRFLPGTKVAERYRIVSLVGKVGWAKSTAPTI